MRAEDLRVYEMLGQDAETGFPLLGTYRMMAIGLSGLGRLHNDLVSSLGWENMDILLTRFGYDGGMSHAAVLTELYDFETPEELLKAGAEMRRFAGLANEELLEVKIEPEEKKLTFKGVWKNSFESELWLSRFGITDRSVCCILAGLVSGYSSAVMGTEVLVRETSCRGKGDPVCEFEGRTVEQWGLTADELRERFSVADVEQELAQLRTELEKASWNLARKDEEIKNLKRSSRPREDYGVIFRSGSMGRTMVLAEKVAPTPSSVLIQGESGTGKEVLARFIHECSGRSSSPFLDINCAALPATLLESELFGHVKGAFTGAETDKRGLLVEAGEGTLFLDEIGEVPLELQAKLLRVLQEKKVRPLGGVESIPVKARVLSATNRNLREMVAENSFREDLYFRLAVFPINIPPLRERRQDILPLARHFLSRHSPDHPGFSPEALKMMEAAGWAGNVRELENWVEYALVMAGAGRIMPEHFPEGHGRKRGDSVLDLTGDLPSMRELEKRYIEQVLAHTGGNRKEAAGILGMGVSTLWRRLKE